jgi:glycosyltransferase involved in cell wall biosynthesis
VEVHELQKGKQAIEKRAFKKPYTLTFIGRVEQAKGADLLLKTLADPTFKASIKTVNLIGSVSTPDHYEALGAEACVPVEFWGSLGRSDLQDILYKSHFLILPSRSEGFPKVIIEAAAYGVIPVVSDVSFISDHIRHKENGFLLEDQSQAGLSDTLDQAFSRSSETLMAMARNAIQTAQDFTYSRFTQKLKQEVFYLD